MLEATGTVEKRKMKAQVLDTMELEQERGITIKMQPARMEHEVDGEKYILNLIDTPGHIDFSYEVSRALKAVEGVILLVDSTQGIQAQTLTTLDMARESGLIIIPVLSKVDAPLARVDQIREEVVELLSCDPDEVLLTSGKTGEGVPELLDSIIKRIPSPEESTEEGFRGLVFDFEYSNHKGVIVYTRVFDGTLKKNDSLTFIASKKSFSVLETGTFSPEMKSKASLTKGEIGYIVTGIKEPGVASVGDTLVFKSKQLTALHGYKTPAPVVWASVFPESQDDFLLLKQSLERLKLSDSSLSFEEESSGALGRGFRCGFLGMLHLEIVTERLRREFNLVLIVATPSITYEVTHQNGDVEQIYTPSKFPEHGTVSEIREPWVHLSVIAPPEYVSGTMQLLYEHEGQIVNSKNFSDGRTITEVEMPLRELMRGFFDRVKSVSSGYASVSYEILDVRPADVVRLDVLVAEEEVQAFSRIVSRRRVDEEARALVEKLHGLLPKQLFITKIQSKALGRIIASKTLSAARKDVTGHLYGGDVTRKKKLLEKQKKGKKKMLARAKVNIPQEVFLKMLKSEE